MVGRRYHHVSWLNKHDDVPLVSSALVEVEVPGALRRSARKR
ncbi:hypothetical protein ACN27G_21600 [Plantactinospora sp. WMMB334]